MAKKTKFEPVPIMPRSLSNPIGKTALINRTIRATNRGIREAERFTIDWFNRQPRQRMVTNDVRYEYLVDVDELTRFIAELKAMLMDGTNPPMTQGAVTGYQVGTAVASENLASLTDAYTRTFDQIIHTAPYQYRVRLLRARIFEQMEGFSGETGADLARVLSNVLETGQNPREAVSLIRDRFRVSRGRAERIARTETLMALRRGRMDEADEARDRLGIQTRMLWFSALSPTTRLTHSHRHGRTYTTAEVREFYATGSDAINCKCSAVETLVDEEGNMRNEKLRKKMAEQRERFAPVR